MKIITSIKVITVLLLVTPYVMNAQYKTVSEKYQSLPLGSIKPAGWLKEQMQKDMAGFVGNLHQLVPDLINDPIYGSERLHKQSKSKDLGNLKAGDAEGDEQYKWWNSETQSNWWDGYIRNAFLLDDQQAIQKVKIYIDRILSTQDEDGYLGIYDKELRYKFTGENGELWAKTTLYRGLLAYYEYTHDENVWNALIRAVDDVMQNYPINESQPFFAGKDFSGGVAHGLTFTDVLDRMHQLTGNQKYAEYAAFLYLNFSENYSSEKDAQLNSIFDPNYKLQSHGVHTYEHLRPLIVATYAQRTSELKNALQIYLERIKACTTPTGGAIGDEWIAGRHADATHTGYEYCSLQELLDSYTLLFEKSGQLEMAEMIERIFYNAAQGARNPNYSAIAYLKTDNSYEMMGTKNGEIEQDRKQTRYKYSPVHQDVAVCCTPNAGRITPYFIQSMWLKENDNTLIASLLGPCIVKTTFNETDVSIEEITEYPFQNHFIYKIEAEQPTEFTIKIRKPAWVKAILTNEKYSLENGYIVISKEFKTLDTIEIEFLTEVNILEDQNGEKAFSYGALLYALPFETVESRGKKYAEGFEDIYYERFHLTNFQFDVNCTPIFQNGSIKVSMKNVTDHQIQQVELIPFGRTILRQVSF